MGLVSDKGSQKDNVHSVKQDWFARIFKERELLLRSEGEVRFLRLSPKLQASVCASALVLATWTAGTSFSSWMQYQDLNEKAVEIVEAKLSYDKLKRGIDRFETRMASLNSHILELIDEEDAESVNALKEEIRRFDGLGTELRTAVKSLSIDLDLPEDEKHRIITSRENLHDQIQELKGFLNESEQRIENLQLDIADLNDDISDSDVEKERIVKERNKLLLSVANLEEQLEDNESMSAGLEDDLKDRNVELSESATAIAELEENDSKLRAELSDLDRNYDQLSREHADAERRIALVARRLSNTAEDKQEYLAGGSKYIVEQEGLERLELQTKRVVGDLAYARQEKTAMDSAIDAVLGGLERVAGFDRSQEKSNRSDTETVLSLLDQIEGLHDSQLDMVNRLNLQATSNIATVEKLIRTTGIDPERMLELSGMPVGQGGPLIVTDFVSGSSDDLDEKVAALETKVKRWEVLQNIAKCIPMVSPVDYYNLTSKFGMRKDPFTNKTAMHKGLDMGGWPGTKVWSTAPGKVTFAGTSGRYGKMVEIDHGCGIKTIYGHLRKVLVKKGQDVGHRHNIGQLGSTGRSTGPHVHFEIRLEGQAVDPMKFIEAGRYVFKS